MKKILIILLITTANNVYAQNILVTKICERSYSRDSIISDTSTFLFGNINLLLDGGACSWTCNQFIRMPNTINGLQYISDSLTDYNTNSVCIIDLPLNKRIQHQVYLEKYTTFGALSEEEANEVYLRGFLLANGNRKSKKEYFNYSRLKKVKVFVNQRLIGIATLRDTPKIQYIDFANSFQLSFDKKIELIIKIEEVYPGNKYTELAISELDLDGFGGHSLTDKFCWSE
jgi:hypothetical protein